jgi:hypothetical protein
MKKTEYLNGWSRGEARRQIGIKNTTQVIPSKKVYSRKQKHKNKDNELRNNQTRSS